MMTELSIPKKNQTNQNREFETLQLPAGTTTIIIGANGAGKTRLAVYIEEELGEKAHRISAHRALNLTLDINKISEAKARNYLVYGHNYDIKQSYFSQYRNQARWDNKSSTHLLNDFEYLLQYLFAQHINTTDSYYQKTIKGENAELTKSKLYQLKETWENLLPHKKLHITADDISVSTTNDEMQAPYSASEMSDVERAIFYILGQVLSANEDSVLIFDEPELHIHQSIIANLWDKIEELRPDCAFLMITHDIEFASTRIAEKYVIRNYYNDPAWDIAKIPDSQFDEQTITTILGSRKPILFVEGTENSLDLPLYRACYPEWTIIPKGSCQAIIQAVSSFSHLSKDIPLLNLECKGIVDNDTRDEAEIARLNKLDIYALPVSEIENLFSLTDIARAILEIEGYQQQELENKLSQFKSKLIEFIKSDLSDDKLEKFAIKLVKRKIDNHLKNIDLSSLSSSEEIKNQLLQAMNDLQHSKIDEWVEQIKEKLQNCLDNDNLDELLTIYENKGLLNQTALLLKSTRKPDFESWLARHFKNQNSKLIQVIKQKLPNLDE